MVLMGMRLNARNFYGFGVLEVFPSKIDQPKHQTIDGERSTAPSSDQWSGRKLFCPVLGFLL